MDTRTDGRTTRVITKDPLGKSGSKIRIPTGGRLFRQIANICLHGVLFNKRIRRIVNTNGLIFWKRFIDDGIGIWKGTRRTFISFLRKLNKATNTYGINFPMDEAQFGKTVHFLDVTFYMDRNNKIQHKGYTKPTDAKRYLRPQSFHPKTVFEAVPYSQMLSTLERNSTIETKQEGIETLKKDFQKSGYSQKILDKIEEKLSTKRAEEQQSSNKSDEAITFPVFFFRWPK